MVLADKNADRWTDEDLLSILDEGHKDLCQHSEILKARVEVPLVFDTSFFPLPDDCWQLTRVTHDNSFMPFVTYTQLDQAYVNNDSSWRTQQPISGPTIDWQTDTGQPEAIIYDRRNMTEGKVYPIPALADTAAATFSSPYGVTTGVVGGTVTPIFGLADDNLNISSPFGLLTDYAIEPSLTCYYLQIPGELTAVTDDLATPIMFDTALKYYVIGNAFLIDLAEEYQAKGLQQLGFYNRELELADKTSSRDHQRAAATRTTYRTGF